MLNVRKAIMMLGCAIVGVTTGFFRLEGSARWTRAPFGKEVKVVNTTARTPNLHLKIYLSLKFWLKMVLDNKIEENWKNDKIDLPSWFEKHVWYSPLPHIFMDWHNCRKEGELKVLWAHKGQIYPKNRHNYKGEAFSPLKLKTCKVCFAMGIIFLVFVFNLCILK